MSSRIVAFIKTYQVANDEACLVVRLHDKNIELYKINKGPSWYKIHCMFEKLYLLSDTDKNKNGYQNTDDWIFIS